MHKLTACIMRSATLLASLMIFAPSPLLAQAPPSESSDVSMTLFNLKGPFVTSDFAKNLGTLVMRQEYPEVTFTADSPVISDKGDTWWVTFTVAQWPKNMEKLRPVIPAQLTVQIRKRDAAILAIR
jgi:hypothetical protein